VRFKPGKELQFCSRWISDVGFGCRQIACLPVDANPAEIRHLKSDIHQRFPVSPEDFATEPLPAAGGADLEPALVEDDDSFIESRRGSLPRPRYWLHTALLLATICTTSLVGSRMQQDFSANLPPLGVEELWDAFVHGWSQPLALLGGLPFSLTLLTILMAHELGHYLTCLRYGLDASLPYFCPRRC